MNKLLLVIDVQYDFLDGGKLGVNGSTEKIDKCVDFVKANGENYELAIATVDWHPITHCSFNENGGQWPSHCIQHSFGAGIYESMLTALNNSTRHFEILTKGCDEDHEEYSIFKNRESCEKLVNLVNKLQIEEIDVCGIAYDYCVADSVKDGLKALPNVKFNVIKEFCPSIGDGGEFTKFIENSERVKLV